jgi:hypothetical protein
MNAPANAVAPRYVWKDGVPASAVVREKVEAAVAAVPGATEPQVVSAPEAVAPREAVPVSEVARTLVQGAAAVVRDRLAVRVGRQALVAMQRTGSAVRLAA